MVGLLGVKFAKERPKELAALRQKISQTHVPGKIARVSLEVKVEALDVRSNGLSIVEVHSSILHDVVFYKIDDSQPLEILKLEKVED